MKTKLGMDDLKSFALGAVILGIAAGLFWLGLTYTIIVKIFLGIGVTAVLVFLSWALGTIVRLKD